MSFLKGLSGPPNNEEPEAEGEIPEQLKENIDQLETTSDSSELAEVARKLGDSGSPQAVQPLIKALLGQVCERWKAEYASQTADLDRTYYLLTQKRAASRASDAIVDALTSIGPPGVDEILQALQNEAKTVAFIDVRIPADMDDARRMAYHYYTAHLTRTLGNIGDERAVAPLKELRNSSSSVIKEAARDALTALNAP